MIWVCGVLGGITGLVHMWVMAKRRRYRQEVNLHQPTDQEA